MNCNCDPPKPVISKIVQKDGPNFGRDYYCCSGPNACNFFAWKDAAQPALLAKFPTAPNKVYQQTSVGSKVGKVKIKLHEIEQSPARAWCSLVGIDFPGLKQLMDTLAEKAQYDRHIKMYVFDFSVYDHVVAQLRMLLGNNLEEIPKFVVQGLNTHFRKVKTRNSTEEPVLDIEPTLAETLRPFQLEGVKFVVRMGGRAYIGDEMGKYSLFC